MEGLGSLVVRRVTWEGVDAFGLAFAKRRVNLQAGSKYESTIIGSLRRWLTILHPYKAVGKLDQKIMIRVQGAIGSDFFR